MKTFNSIMMAIAALSVLALNGCESRIEQPAAENETQIFLTPGIYGAFTDPQTRVTNPVDLDNANGYNDFYSAPMLTKLPLGTTVWLTYRKAKVTYPNTENPSDWDEPNLRAYVVQNVAGYNALYPISSHNITENGIEYLEIDEPIQYTTPLFLEDGDYQFRMVSPANKIVKENLKMIVDNGMYVYANDERYSQTRSKIIRIAPTGTGVQNIVLNPMINQTARIKVTLTPGENVSRMEMMSEGVEVSGLQNPEMEPGGKLKFDWSSMSIQDTLKMKLADKRSRVSITEFEKDETTGVIVGDIGVLPTDAMSTNMVILINMAVNGIPTQYLVTLSQLRLYHGHSYNLDLQVNLSGDIYVMNWSNQSWTGSVKFE